MTQSNDILYNSLLVDYCSGNYENVRQFLEVYPNLDLTYLDGACFHKAIMHSNVKILSALLDYYKTHRLSSDKDSIEYKKALFDLKHILEEAKEMYGFSPEIQKLLEPYIGSDEDIESDVDVRDSEIGADLLLREDSEDMNSSDTDRSLGHSGHESNEDSSQPQQNTYGDWGVVLVGRVEGNYSDSGQSHEGNA